MKLISEEEINYFKQLDERQQRLYAGLLAKQLGHGGIKKVSAALGIHANTVSQGKRELTNLPEPPKKRIRKIGGGTKKN
jgi:hypothetical protein